MDDSAYAGELFSGLVYVIVGVRLLWLSRRTAQLPERLLGVAFALTGVSYILYVVPIVYPMEALWTPLNFAGRVAFLPAALLIAVFTRRVFRLGEPWTAWLVWLVGILLLAGVGGSALEGDWEGFSISSGWFWLEWIGYTVPYGWAGVEALIQYTQARKRMRLGLCEPIVCNRYLLWALFGLIEVGVSFAVLPQYADYESSNAFSATWDAIVGGGEVAAIVTVGLVFFAPAFYRRWVEAAASGSTQVAHRDAG